MFDPVSLTAMLDELTKLSASKNRMAVSQTRTGRRPISVDTLLKKDREGTLFRKSEHVSDRRREPE